MPIQTTVRPLPLPQFMNDPFNLRMILGQGLVLAGLLIFSLWQDRFVTVKENERTWFLLFNVWFGGSWLLAIFAVCGGIYFLFGSIFEWPLI